MRGCKGSRSSGAPFGRWVQAALAVVCALLLFCTPCAVRAQAFTVRDTLGRTVAFKAPIQRAVLLHTAAMELARIASAEQLVVGASEHVVKESQMMGYSYIPPSVGTWRSPDIEGIVRLRPEVVITYPGAVTYLEERLKPFGIPVLRFDLHKINTMQREIAMLGQLFGRTSDLARFMAWQDGILERIKGSAVKLPAHKSRVYLESFANYRLAGTDSGLHQMCIFVGCTDIASSAGPGTRDVAPEWVIQQNPDAIVKMHSITYEYSLADARLYNSVRDAMIKRPAWRNLKAVQAGRVFVIESSLFSTPRSVIGAVYLAKWLYPHLYADVNPDALHREYFEKFLRRPFRGSYVSDPYRQSASPVKLLSRFPGCTASHRP